MPEDTKRIEVLDFLRGVAALAVVCHHFFGMITPGALRTYSYYGHLGVHVFFVISGFVIPYSMHRGRYRLGDYGTFMLKRILRLDPPYFATIAIIIGLGMLSWYVPFQKRGVFHATLPQVLLHAVYANTFFGYPWLIDVFWTLAIEFQYYVLIGLAFPLLFSGYAGVRLASFALLGAPTFFFRLPTFVFYFMFVFLMGVLTCQYRVRLIGSLQCAALLAVATTLAFETTGGVVTAVAGLTVCTILWLRAPPPGFQFLGQISYSLYLLHIPIGRRVLDALLRAGAAGNPVWELAAILAATAVSILAAYGLYRLVERPARRWSAALRYRERRAVAAP